ncbi:lambda-crystallin-like [Glandiceps talaboti]
MATYEGRLVRCPGKVAIVGCGLIGSGWATLFTSAGYKVSLYDADPSVASASVEKITQLLHELEKNKMLRGDLTVDEQLRLISICDKLEDAIEGAIYVQESVPENPKIKKEVFQLMDEVVDDGTILASSASTLVPSSFTGDIKHRGNCVVCHPMNPIYSLPIVEIVPAPWTDKQIVTRTKTLMEEVGLKPIVLAKEKVGFLVNRIQFALMNECFRLVEEGVVSPQDIDTCLNWGIGMKYTFCGPLETCHLAAQGFKDMIQKFGPVMKKVCEDVGPIPSYTGGYIDEIDECMKQRIPLDKLEQQRHLQARRLRALYNFKKDTEKEEKD